MGTKRVSLSELFRLAAPVKGKKGLLRSIHTTQANGVPVKVIFVCNRNKKSDWLAILSTDCTLTLLVCRLAKLCQGIPVYFSLRKLSY